MADVNDVAAAVVQESGSLTTMKLQKLVYYCQAWHTVWEGQPLFGSRVEAWARGPMAIDLWAIHRRQHRVTSWAQGTASNLSETQQRTVTDIMKLYGQLSAEDLSDLAHSETPWLHARGDLPINASGNEEITIDAMDAYYGDLTAFGRHRPVAEQAEEFLRQVNQQARAAEAIFDYERRVASNEPYDDLVSAEELTSRYFS